MTRTADGETFLAVQATAVASSPARLHQCSPQLLVPLLQRLFQLSNRVSQTADIFGCRRCRHARAARGALRSVRGYIASSLTLGELLLEASGACGGFLLALGAFAHGLGHGGELGFGAGCLGRRRESLGSMGSQGGLAGAVEI